MRSSIPALLAWLATTVPTVASAQETSPPPAVSVTTTPDPPPAPPPPPTPAGGTIAVAERTGAPPLQGVSVWGILPWGGYGFGARYMIPLGIPSLIRHGRIKDSWALEFGADYLHWSYGYFGSPYDWNAFLPVASMMWNVWLTPEFAVYPKVEGGFAFGWYTGWEGSTVGRPSHGGPFVNGAGGVLYKLNNGITLRGEIGIAGLKLGAGFLF